MLSFCRSYNYADPTTNRDEDKREVERRRRERMRIEEDSLASGSETTSVYSMRVRRISSADETDRIGQVVQGVNFVWMSVRYGRVYATARCTFCIYIPRVLREQTGPFVIRIASHHVGITSHRYSCRHSKWNLANPLFSANLNDFPSSEIETREFLDSYAKLNDRDNALPDNNY